MIAVTADHCALGFNPGVPLTVVVPGVTAASVITPVPMLSMLIWVPTAKLNVAQPLVEGVRMSTNALTAQQFSITVSEHGYALAVSELLLNASFDDVMASASRLLGRNMAIYLDQISRDTLYGATSVIYGYDRSGLSAVNNWYDKGTKGHHTRKHDW